MKHTQSVLPVDLNEDLRDERADILGILLLISGILSLLLFVSLSQFGQANGGIEPRGFIILAVCTALSYLLLKAKRINGAAYTFIVGLIVCFALQLSFIGPNALAYTLLILPIGVASLILETSEMSTVATLVAISAIVFPSFAIGFGPAIVPGLIPVAVYAGIAAMFGAEKLCCIAQHAEEKCLQSNFAVALRYVRYVAPAVHEFLEELKKFELQTLSVRTHSLDG